VVPCVEDNAGALIPEYPRGRKYESIAQLHVKNAAIQWLCARQLKGALQAERRPGNLSASLQQQAYQVEGKEGIVLRDKNSPALQWLIGAHASAHVGTHKPIA
jgi:hypothetical protein